MRNHISNNLNPSQIFQKVWGGNIRQFSSFVEDRINPELRTAIRELVQHNAEDPYKDYKDIQFSATALVKQTLNSQSRELMDEMATKGETSLVLFKDCPVSGEGGLPSTPNTDTQPKEKDYVSEYFMLGLGGLLQCKPYIAVGEKDESIIHQVIPLNPNSISGTGSKIKFNLHTENAHELNPPDFFLLLCLKGDLKADTTYCLLDDLLKSMPESVIKQLEKPEFIFKTGDSFTKHDQIQGSILTRNNYGIYEIRVNTALNRCNPISQDASKALEYVKDHLENGLDVHSVNLTQGDMLVINNKRMLHGRQGFEPSTTPEEKRWLQRMYLKKDSQSHVESLIDRKEKNEDKSR